MKTTEKCPLCSKRCDKGALRCSAGRNFFGLNSHHQITWGFPVFMKMLQRNSPR